MQRAQRDIISSGNNLPSTPAQVTPCYGSTCCDCVCTGPVFRPHPSPHLRSRPQHATHVSVQLPTQQRPKLITDCEHKKKTTHTRKNLVYNQRANSWPKDWIRRVLRQSTLRHAACSTVCVACMCRVIKFLPPRVRGLNCVCSYFTTVPCLCAVVIGV